MRKHHRLSNMWFVGHFGSAEVCIEPWAKCIVAYLAVCRILSVFFCLNMKQIYNKSVEAHLNILSISDHSPELKALPILERRYGYVK